jgi:hypothetical protein
MKSTQITQRISIETEREMLEIKEVLNLKLISIFKKLGLNSIRKGEYIIFSRYFQKPTDFIQTGQKRTFLKLIRNAKSKIFISETNSKILELSVDLTHLYILSVVYSLSFCLGTVFFVSSIGLFNYLLTALLIFVFSFIGGLLIVKIKTMKILKEVLN